MNLFLISDFTGSFHPLLDVKFYGKQLTHKQLKNLEAVPKHITCPSLARANICDAGPLIICQFENLRRLRLGKTYVSDMGFNVIANLKHPEAPNPYGINFSTARLPDLQKTESLKRAYL